MAFKKPTAKMVALEAGISMTTVSHFLSGRPNACSLETALAGTRAKSMGRGGINWFENIDVGPPTPSPSGGGGGGGGSRNPEAHGSIGGRVSF